MKYKKNTAKLSACRNYRYALWRTWDPYKPRVMFIGLNPSTADEKNDDPTLRRCMDFAKKWDYGGLCIANLFAYRATEPREMKVSEDPIGPDNDKWLKKLSKQSELVIAAWGNDGQFLNRSEKVLKLIKDIHYLKMNKSGEPAHPLYLRAELKPLPLKISAKSQSEK